MEWLYSEENNSSDVVDHENDDNVDGDDDL